MRNSRSLPFAWILMIFCFCLCSCGPKEQPEFKRVDNLYLEGGSEPYLTGEAVFFNPNKIGGKLKGIYLDIYVNDKKSGTIDDSPKLSIKPMSEFRVPFKIKLYVDENNLLNTLLGFLGSKKMNVHLEGHLKTSFSGVPVKVPLSYSREIKWR